MTQTRYVPPKVWEPAEPNGGRFANVNRPTAGAQFEGELPVGANPIQLYSMATPNGVKVSVMLEELLEAGETGAAYDAHRIDIMQGDQFSSGFVAINPNSKIPAIVDRSGAEPVRVFESGAILLHLAERFGCFLPDGNVRTEALCWLFWQMGSAPYLGGGFGHFYRYAPEPMQYPIDRFTMEVKRQLSVLDQLLAERTYMAGDEYTIADIATWSWYGQVVLGRVYDAAEFLDAASYPNVLRWASDIAVRPAVQRGASVLRKTD